MFEKKSKEMVCRLREYKEFQSLWFLKFLPKKMSSRKSKGKMVGCSTEKMEQKAYNQLERETEEIVSWRSLSKEEIHDISKKNVGKMGEEVLVNTMWRVAKGNPKEEEVSLRNG